MNSDKRDFGSLASKSCAVYGEIDAPNTIRPLIRETFVDLIENHEVKFFEIKYRGNFEMLAMKELFLLRCEYPHLYISITAMDMSDEISEVDFDAVYYGDDNFITPKYELSPTTEAYIDGAQYIVAYAKRPLGHAMSFIQYALEKKKKVINLADMNDIK